MAAEAGVYLVVGRGRWAGLIREILLGEGRQVATLADARAGSCEPAAEYRARLERAMRESGASVAWLCVPFGPWVAEMAAAAMSAGLDVIAECPWLGSPEVTDSLLALGKKTRRAVSVHYEYCMLEEIGRWREEFGGGAGLRFHGIFQIGRPGRHGAVAELQLGSHLLSLWQYAVPEAELGELRCGYESEEQRAVWLTRDGVTVSRVEFLLNQQPLIQRFVYSFEEGRAGGHAIFGLEFAKRIAAAAGQR